MKTVNGELLDYTKRAIDDIYVSGNCCVYVHKYLYEMFRNIFTIYENVELMTMENMKNWLLEKAPKSCNQYANIVEYIMKILEDNRVRYD